MTDLMSIDPDRAPGAFTYGVTQLHVLDDGLAPGHAIEVIDVIATLAECVKRLTAAERTPDAPKHAPQGATVTNFDHYLDVTGDARRASARPDALGHAGAMSEPVGSTLGEWDYPRRLRHQQRTPIPGRMMDVAARFMATSLPAWPGRHTPAGGQLSAPPSLAGGCERRPPGPRPPKSTRGARGKIR
jgi:hypothetical protein